MSKFLSVNEIQQLLSLSTTNPRDHALFHLSINTGLRISDILPIKRAAIIDKDGLPVRMLRIRMKKTRAWVNRPLRDDCRAVIAAYLGNRSDKNPYLFPPLHTNQHTQSNAPMSRMTAHRIYKKYLQMIFPDSEIVRASTHTARRSMAKIISNKSGRIEPATRFLGHKNPASTAAYIDMGGYEEAANEIILHDIDLGEQLPAPKKRARRKI